MRMIEKRFITLRKVKGHNGDGFDTRSDRLAVQGRDKQAKEVCVKLKMKIPVCDKKGRFGRIRFTPISMMVTEMTVSAEAFHGTEVFSASVYDLHPGNGHADVIFGGPLIG
jgi:hypothetical protein